MADKRKNPIPKAVQLERRAKFYADIDEGNLSLGEAIKEARTISGLTQIEFAEHRKVSLKIIKQIESGTGNPTMKTLNQIMQIFALEVAFRRIGKTR